MENIVLYTNNCSKCEVLKRRLDTAELKYELFCDIDQMIALGMTSAPMLKVDGELMNYKDAMQWVHALSRNC